MKTSTIEKSIDLEYEIILGWNIIPENIEEIETTFTTVNEAIRSANQYKKINGVGYIDININIVNNTAKEGEQKCFVMDTIEIL